MWRGIARAKPFLGGRAMIMAGHRDQKIVAYPVDPDVGPDGLININWVAEDTLDDKMPPREDWNKQASVTDVAARFTNWRFSWLDVPALIAAAPLLLRVSESRSRSDPALVVRARGLAGRCRAPDAPAGSNGATQAIVDAPALAEALSRYPDPRLPCRLGEAERRPPIVELVRINREQMGPESVMILAEQRAPDGFKDVLDVLTADELEQASRAYRTASGAERARR